MGAGLGGHQVGLGAAAKVRLSPGWDQGDEAKASVHTPWEWTRPGRASRPGTRGSPRVPRVKSPWVGAEGQGRSRVEARRSRFRHIVATLYAR